MTNQNVNESDDDEVEGENEEQDIDPVSSMIDAIVDKDFVAAGERFSNIINIKLSDALEGERIATAGEMFSDDEDIDANITDEDLAAAIVDDEDDDEDDGE